mmetsp:Transcript_66077/g.132608  ORF Transcript_66077/g.132608 Transcript_66077/m.132608 type:complete len:223 (+) Transcript_66077:458-1126(+)
MPGASWAWFGQASSLLRRPSALAPKRSEYSTETGEARAPAARAPASTASSRSFVTPPFRSTTTRSCARSSRRTVDSMPTPHAPPSRMRRVSTWPRSSSTCSGSVGEMCPKRFAEGAARGTPAAAMSCLARAWSGQRTATKPVEAVTSGGTAGFALPTMLSGPGQHATASALKTECSLTSSSRSRSASPAAETWRMHGSLSGRPLASKMPSTACASRPLAPRP